MPHKRNPEKCERVCGLARVLRANSIAALENIALWHERDISQSSVERVIIPDSCLALDYILTLFTDIVKGLVVYPQRMLREHGDQPRRRLLPARPPRARRQGHAAADAATPSSSAPATSLSTRSAPSARRSAEEPEVQARLSPAELDAIFDYGYFVREVDKSFARMGLLHD